ncbi:Growth_factor receptor cysteine-rich domain superfamily [Hexamita inflata]|uniref:Growth factor receptor cysteine-rich domain superfamily n=1 Tax=Hexamita inflata TaxID=28002 RepID=A0AA86PP99_9EUKA|nr:Growth factor receptor cysteine-rich domain superfamily [Hexamita inflata]
MFNTNFEKLGNKCVCPQDKYISSDKTQCLKQCPLENIKDGIFCKICSEGKVPNVGKTICVENTCEPGYLNSAGTFCIENCLKQYAPDSNRQCKLCSIVNQYGIWDQNEQKCICGEQTVGVFPICKFCYEQVQISVYSNGKCICGEGTSGEYPKCECLKNYEKSFKNVFVHVNLHQIINALINAILVKYFQMEPHIAQNVKIIKLQTMIKRNVQRWTHAHHISQILNKINVLLNAKPMLNQPLISVNVLMASLLLVIFVNNHKQQQLVLKIFLCLLVFQISVLKTKY